MWLTKSSVGRKVVMSVTGLFLILFLTFHALMNAVAMIHFEWYDAVCEFLGANWYAVLGTLILAAGCVLHILFAFWLTLQNRKARGNNSYAVSKRPANVEWASQNMLVLGIIIACFIVLHLIQFWTKMQVPEIMGKHVMAGSAYLQATFSNWWVLPIYIVAFCALWLHITHGFWSAFQTLGTTNDKWIERFKCLGKWWATIVIGLFIVEAIYFTLHFNGIIHF